MVTPPRSVRYFVVLFAAALLAGACSFTRLAYHNATLAYSNAAPMLTWMVGDYVDLTGDQKEWVRARLDDAMQWHRGRELPEYERFFEAMLGIARHGGAKPEEVRAAYSEVRDHYHRALEHVLPDAADLLLRLDSGQIAHLEKKFAADNRKFVKESVEGTPAERDHKAAMRYIEHFESWVGPLDRGQRELVERRVAALDELVEERLADRRYRQSELLALVRAKPDRDRMIEGLRRLFVQPETWRRPQFLAKQRSRDDRIFAMIAELSGTLSDEQRATLVRHLRGYVRDIEHLTAAEGRAVRASS